MYTCNMCIYTQVMVNSPPVLGKFKVSPMDGDCLVTNFNMEAPGWLDEDLPVNILFGYIDYSQTPPLRVPLGSRSQQIDLRTALPVGNPDAQFKLTVFCEVTDGLGAVRNAMCQAANAAPDCEVTVKRWKFDMTQLKETVDRAMAANKALDNAALTMAYAALLSLTMKRGVEPERRRQDAVPDFSVQIIESIEKALPTMNDDTRKQAAISLHAAFMASAQVVLSYSQTAFRIYGTLLRDRTATIDQDTANAIAQGLATTNSALSRMAREAQKLPASWTAAKQAEFQLMQQSLFTYINSMMTSTMRELGPGEAPDSIRSEGLQVSAKRVTLNTLKMGYNKAVACSADPNCIKMLDTDNSFEEVLILK